MEDIYLSEICEILHHAALNNDITISELSRKTDIAREIVRHILLYFYEFPFGGISISCKGIPKNFDIFDIDESVLDESIKWNIATKEMDKIPVENFDQHEQYILFSMLQEALKEQKSVLSFGIGSQQSATITKGMCGEIADVFKLKHYPLIKKALIKSRFIDVVLHGSGEYVRLKPLGIVYHSEELNWYLVCMDEKAGLHPYRIEDFTSVCLGEDFRYPKDFDMNSFLKGYFDMERGSCEYVEVLFKNEGNVVEKARHRLEGKGDISFLENGSMIFQGNLVGLKEFKTWILGFGSSAVMKAPLWLREEIIATQQKILDNYMNIDRYKEKVHKITAIDSLSL